LLYLGEFRWDTHNEFFNFFDIQFKVEKSDSVDFESMQRRTEIVFAVKLQTSHEISHRKNNFGS